jgi:hypothetical protein
MKGWKMADESTATPEAQGNSECQCVRWHSPKGPTTLVGGVPTCLVTAHKVQELLAKYEAKGKIVKADQKGASKYQKELSEKVYGSLSEPAAPAVQAETAGSEQEPVSVEA